MSAGCFSWCPFSQRAAKTKPKKEKVNTILPGTESVREVVPTEDDEGQVVVRSPNQESLINDRIVSATTTQYITASAKEVLSVLESAAGVIPVPLLKESIGVALKIIQLCEEASAVEQKVKELQNRVGHLMVIIVDNVTSKNEDGSKEMVVEAAKNIESDVEGLLCTLGTINGDLAEISAQKRWAVVLYKEVNMNTLQDCIDRLSTALERFQLANDLREYDLIQEVSNRLQKMANKVDNIAVTVGDIAHEVGDISEKVDKLAENFQDLYKRSLAQTPPDDIARHEMPLKPEVFYGRNEVVEDITQLLVKEETSRVCILGPGGMGKTSISLAVVETPIVQNRFSNNIIWVPCVGATSKALFLEILYIQLQITGDKQVTLQKIISELSASAEPLLIILDNFETPLISSATTQKDVEDILRKLAELKHIAILVTMRGSHPPCHIAIQWQTKNIQPTDEEANLQIFESLNPSSKNDPDVKLLLRVLGQMPFAVTLMATLAEESHSTPKALMELWAESGPDILSEDREQSMNRSIALSVESDLVQRSPNALLLLSILSLLPAGTSKDNLQWWAPTLRKSTIPAAIITLSRAGLLIENKGQGPDTSVLFVIPVVQSFMQHQRIGGELRQQILLSCCQFILGHASRFLDPSFSINSKALLSEDTNIQAILLKSTSSQYVSFPDKYMEALISFCWYRCDTKPSLDIVNFALSAARASGSEDYIARLLWCLGRTHYQLGSLRQSYKYLQEGHQLLGKISSRDPKLRQICGQCRIDFNDTARMVINDHEKLVSWALDTEAQCSPLSDDLHGRSLVFVGTVLIDAHRHQEALGYLEHAKAILKAVGATASFADACQAIARLHHLENRLPEALDAMQEALDQARLCGSLPLEGEISLEFGLILLSANRDAEAWAHLQVSLMRSSYLGDRFLAAQTLECMGYVYLHKREYGNALGAYNAAAENFSAVDDEVSQNLCRENAVRIRQKQENPGMAISFHRPSPVNDRSQFYP